MMMRAAMRHAVFAVAIAISGSAAAQTGFGPGPLIKDFGRIAPVDTDIATPPGTTFKIAFDTRERATRGETNRTLDAAARFLNMEVAAGTPAQDIRLAVVLHGQAVFDVTGPGAYARNAPVESAAAANANAPLVAALLTHGVRVIVCGQSAVALGVAKSELLPGVELARSAMAAHALLQQQGYTLNP